MVKLEVGFADTPEKGFLIYLYIQICSYTRPLVILENSMIFSSSNIRDGSIDIGKLGILHEL